MPTEWNQSIICPIYSYKKGEKSECSIIEESHSAILHIRS